MPACLPGFAYLGVLQAEEAGEDAPPGDPSLVRLLLEHKASPNLPNIECATPLHLALMGGLNEVVELLLTPAQSCP